MVTQRLPRRPVLQFPACHLSWVGPTPLGWDGHGWVRGLAPCAGAGHGLQWGDSIRLPSSLFAGEIRAQM